MAAPSIRLRVLDLLGTFRDEWVNVERVLIEYESRWAEVNPESFRRTITRLLDTDSDLVESRYVDGVFSVNGNLELRMSSDAYWSLAEGDWDNVEELSDDIQVA